MDLKTVFDNAIKSTLNYNEKLYRNDINYPMYFNTEYINKLGDYFRENNITCYNTHEYIAPYQNKEVYKMCSAASSSRLALFFVEDLKKKSDHNIILEKECNNGLNVGENPQLDAWDSDKNIYFECKCHEICSNSHGGLKLKYKEKLSELFDLNPTLITDEKEPCFHLTLEDFGVQNFINDYNAETNIRKLHFDVKQFICHLIGIENSDKTDATLKYIFFTPNEYYINDEIKLLYKNLKDEINMVNNSRSLKYFFERHNIKFEYELISVDTFNDLIVENMQFNEEVEKE